MSFVSYPLACPFAQPAEETGYVDDDPASRDVLAQKQQLQNLHLMIFSGEIIDFHHLKRLKLNVVGIQTPFAATSTARQLGKHGEQSEHS